MYGITYNDKHSFKDLGITILNTRTIGTPSKVKITQTIPFMNGNYDFSNLYGDNCYTERRLEYEFLLKSNSNAELEFKRMLVDSWLLENNTKSPLYDDNVAGFYYLAECESVEFEEINNIGKLKAYFIAYPFKISNNYEGSDIWNEFNFEYDILQDTKFNVKGNIETSIYNASIIEIVPTVITTSEFEVVLNNKKYSINRGSSKDYKFKFKKGENKLTIKGNGVIEFRFKREVL